MKKNLTIELGNGNKLVAELCEYPNSDIKSEIVICIQDKDGIAIQDIALARPQENENGTEVLIWADENDEDYTNKFVINEYEEEEEMEATRKAYEEYKKEWVKDHISEEIQEETHEEYLDYCLDINVDDDYTFEDYLNEYGYNGQLYVCFEEFVNNEYQEMLEDEEEKEMRTTRTKEEIRNYLILDNNNDEDINLQLIKDALQVENKYYDNIINGNYEYACACDFINSSFILEDEDNIEDLVKIDQIGGIVVYYKTYKNKPFKVLVTETYKKEVIVYAQNEDEAYDRVEELVNEGTIDASDCTGEYEYERECFNQGEADDYDLDNLQVFDE